MKKNTTSKAAAPNTAAAKAKTPAKAKVPAKPAAPVKEAAPAAAKAAVKAKAPIAAKAPAAAKVKKTTSKIKVTFTYRAEKGCSVFLAGDFNKWSATANEMTDKKGNGIYTAELKLAAGSYEYKYVIDGTWCADPECADWIQNDHGTLNSVKHVSA
jgi:1,4-alpha-glucan branching enzyme